MNFLQLEQERCSGRAVWGEVKHESYWIYRMLEGHIDSMRRDCGLFLQARAVPS